MPEAISNFKLVAKLLGNLQLSIDTAAQTASVPQGRNVTPNTAITNGTGANQADRAWAIGVGDDNPRTLASGANEDLDLYDLAAIDIGAGAGKTALGQDWTLAEIVAVLFHVDPDSDGTMVIGGGGAATALNSFFNGSDSAQLGPFGADGGVLLWNHGVANAFAVADVTNHLLKITEASAGGVLSYRAVVLGRSA